ncbi:DUF1013 domain-containing protein [bacterium]|nr:DUF1013 domain-containing protein [bacterium]
MTQLLMPRATAVWLIDNSALTFVQIGDFCNLHELEVQAIADGEIGPGMQGFDPILNDQLTRAELERCEADETASLKAARSTLPEPTARTKGPRYVPIARRGDKPDAISWLVKHHPELTNAQIGRLIGTTKDTIMKIRERSHWNISNIQPKHPAMLGLCSQNDLNAAIEKAGGQPKLDAEQVTDILELP